jgi:Flp pilus assembly protein TadG
VRRQQRRCAGDRGDVAALEAVILMPAVLAAFALAIVFGRAQGASNSISHAAHAGARAAASAQTHAGAVERASAAVARALAESPCVEYEISVAGTWSPGGSAFVSVSCAVDLSDVSGLIVVPGSRTATATASEPVDTIRGGQ